MRRMLLVVLAVITIQAATAQVRILAVTDSATFTPRLPAYGSLASIGVTGLTGISGIQTATQYPLPYEIAGISVQVNGSAARLLAVADMGWYQQINIQVPAWQGAVPIIEVSQAGQSVQVQSQNVSPTWGVMFTDSSGYAAVQHADYSLVTPGHPAQPGEVLIAYATNLGSFDNVSHAPPTGFPAQADPLPSLLATSAYEVPYVSVNGTNAETFYAGLTPGSVGVFQLNFRLPDGIPDGDATLWVIKFPSCFGGLCPDVMRSRPAKLPVRATGSSQ
jgi:uncharacterized protein (TIGR03437 family)